MDLTTATPAEIDAILADLLARRAAAMGRAERYVGLARGAENVHDTHTAERYEAEAARHAEEANQLDRSAAPLDAEYVRRGGWTRAYVVQGGHVHRSTTCFTLQIGTRVGWLTEVSGMTADEVVDLAGERACTFCYPDAPVAVLARPSRLKEDVAAREADTAAQAEKAAKRAAKDAKKITNPDGTPLRGRWGIIGSAVTAWNEAVSDLADVELYGYSWSSENELANQAIVAALAAKLGQTEEEIRTTLKTKVAAKVKRESRGR